MGAEPPCTCACPVNLDIRKMMDFVQKGSFVQAYKMYREAVAFPAIVSRVCPQYCKNACVRVPVDRYIDIKNIERACVEYAGNTEPTRFGIPKRGKSVAVIGAGMAGLACGMRLASRGYDVTVYEKENKPGGRLHSVLPENIILDEIAFQMKGSKCVVEYGREIKSLDELQADAFVIATGENGFGSEYKEGMDERSYGSQTPGVFVIGAAIGAGFVEDIAQGAVAAISVDKYIKIGKMDGMEDSFMKTESCIKKNPDVMEKTEAVVPSGEVYTKEEAIAESIRCLKCDCNDCGNVCELFDFFKKYPKAIAGEAFASMHMGGFITKQTTVRTISSCNLCGLCGKVCEKNIDIGKLSLDFRHFKMNNQHYPEGFSDFFVRDMFQANTDAHLASLAPGSEKAELMFFPGCGLGGSDPRYVTESYRYLLSVCPDTAIYLGCCGAPADWGARDALNDEAIGKIREKWEEFGKPVIVTACATCMRQLSKFIPEAQLKSLYEVMAENGIEVKESFGGETMNVFDPCASREYSEMQKSVRLLSEKAGAKLEELKFSEEKARCCGWGGHILNANKKLAEQMVENRMNETSHPYVTYCTNCRDTFAWRGKECVHILDAVFGLNAKDRVPASLGEKQINRLKAKNEILETVFGEKTETIPEGAYTMNIKISPEMTAKLSRLFILESEIEKTIKYLEETQNSVYNVEKDTYIGYLLIGIITYWVEYRKTGDGEFELVNAYSHRVQIDTDAVKG